MKNIDYPIDAVVTWVDGNDPVHRQKRAMYMSGTKEKRDDVGGDIRYTSIGEIKYCIASLLKFAPFLSQIFIVTDGQDPGLEEFIEKNFPGQYSKIRIIDHKIIFRGYEEYLPVFNSRAIETVLWRIPGLSEHYIFLNDDFVLVAPTRPEDFFQGDNVICYANPFSIRFAKFLQFLKPAKNGQRRISFKYSMVKAAEAVGEKRRFLRLGHNPHSLRVSVFENFYKEHPEKLLSNISHRFRHESEFNSAELCYLLLRQQGRLIVRPKNGVNLYLLPKGKHYMENHIREFENARTEKFCCINSLDYASKEDQERVLSWIDLKLELA